LVPQLAVGLAVKNARHRGDLPFPDPDHDLGVLPDVLDPRGGFTRFGEQIKTLAADHEPNLDLARQTRPAPDRSQM
jgi:hypothetical protein